MALENESPINSVESTDSNIHSPQLGSGSEDSATGFLRIKSVTEINAAEISPKQKRKLPNWMGNENSAEKRPKRGRLGKPTNNQNGDVVDGISSSVCNSGEASAGPSIANKDAENKNNRKRQDRNKNQDSNIDEHMPNSSNDVGTSGTVQVKQEDDDEQPSNSKVDEYKPNSHNNADTSDAPQVKQEDEGEQPSSSNGTDKVGIGNVKIMKQAEIVKEEATSTTRDSCQYGIRCYRRNPAHRSEVAHPGDSDYRRPDYPTPPLGTPNCQYGDLCYRRNPVHFQTFSHPPSTDPHKNWKERLRRMRRARAKGKNNNSNCNSPNRRRKSNEDGDDEDDYDLDDPFIDDGSSDYEPSDTDDTDTDLND